MTTSRLSTATKGSVTWSTIPRAVWIEDSNGCIIGSVTFYASTPEEAVQCARGEFGEAVLAGKPEDFALSVTCPHTGCNDRTYPGRDEESAKQCAEATAIGCTVSDEPCPP